MGHVSASERVGSGSGNFLKRRLKEQARASYSAGAHLPTETSSHGGESRRFICSRPLGCLGLWHQQQTELVSPRLRQLD